MSVYEDNIRSLKNLFPSFERDILKTFSPGANLEIIASPSGAPTAKLKGRLLHSAYAPASEAVKLAEQRELGMASHVIIAGFGLGYLPEACLAINKTGYIIVIEPDVPLFLEALTVRPFSGLFSSPRFSLLLAADPAALYSILPPHAGGVIKLVKFRPLYETYKDYFDRVESVVAAYVNRQTINENTLKRFGKLWVRNMLANLPLLPKAAPVAALHGTFQNLPALVLAAGPSLDDVIPLLAELRKRCVIIAVDTALNACLKGGIEPDFLVVVDPQYWNFRHLDKLSSCTCMLVSESSTYPAVFRRHKGRVFFCGSIFPLSGYFESVTGELGKLGAGGSVATTAWDFARVLGLRPIFFAGLDLSFPDKATHYKGSFFEERSLALAGRFVPIETMAFRYIHDAGPYYEENNSGGKTLTDKRLSLYKWWFENQFTMYPDTDTRTLSSKGIRIQGLPFAATGPLLDLPVIRGRIDEALGPFRRREKENDTSGASPALEKVLIALTQGLENLKNNAAQAEILAEKLAAGDDNRNDKKREDRNRILAELEKLDGKLLSSEARDIAGFLAQTSARTVLAGAHTVSSLGEAVDNSLRMYRELVSSADYHLTLLKTAMTRLA